MSANPLPTPQDNAETVRGLEQAMLAAAAQRHPGRQFATVDLHISFMRAASGATGPLSASAEVVGGGKTLSFCEARLTAADGAVVAQALGTLRAL